MNKAVFLLLIFFLTSSFAFAGYYEDGKRFSDACKYKEALLSFEKLVEIDPSAANYRLLAEACEKAEMYDKAVKAYRKEASIYRKNGDINAAIIEEQKANALDVEFKLYYALPAGNKTQNLSKGEPLRGCYTGAYIEDDRRILGNFEKFNKYTGKNHSTFYTYLHYGRPFPMAWCQAIKKLGAIPHIAWEPDSLDNVNDDDYIRNFVRDSATLDWPVFIRFASEMNGDWTPYNGNPALYKQKFKLVHDIFEELAPKVMMLWTPNSIPQSTINDYYPGDDCVDWVGVNIYSVHHHGSDLSRNAEKEDPTYLLEYVYNIYSPRKPIHISEFASTHFCKACGKEVMDFGINKMYQMYWSLPLVFPRVKCIDWFDCDTINETGYSVTSPNNYSLTNNLKVLNEYRNLISFDYFLNNLNSDGNPEIPSYTFVSLTDKSVLSGETVICSFIRSYLKNPQINYYIDGSKILSVKRQPFFVQIICHNFKPGNHLLRAELEGDGRGVIASRKIKFSIEKGKFSIKVPEVKPVTDSLSIESKGSNYLYNEKWAGWAPGGEEVIDFTPAPIPTLIEPSPTVNSIVNPVTTPIKIIPSPSPTEISRQQSFMEKMIISLKYIKSIYYFIKDPAHLKWVIIFLGISVLLSIILIIIRSNFIKKYVFVLLYVIKRFLRY